MSAQDPIAEMRRDVRALLAAEQIPDSLVQDDAVIRSDVRWRPHVWDMQNGRAWHCAPEDSDRESWMGRVARARAAMPELKVGVYAEASVVSDVLDELDSMEAAIIVRGEEAVSGMPAAPVLSASVCDFIYEQRIALDGPLARSILDRNYARALAATDSTEKGIRLETVVAVTLSQVTGYHVAHKGISNRTQQMDVLVVNRNASGVLAGGSIVLAEAKNWKDPVGTTEYYVLMRKVEGRNGRCKLGVLITSGRFTRGVDDEARVDSAKDVMILRLDGETFPALWRSPKGISAAFEEKMIACMIGT